MYADDAELAVRIRLLRKRKIWSQRQLARAMRDLADPRERAQLPLLDSMCRRIRSHEAGAAVGGVYGELYRRVLARYEASCAPVGRVTTPSRNRVGVEPLDLPGRVASVVGRHVGRGLVADLQAKVHRLRLADDVLAGRDLLVPAFRALDAALHAQRETNHSAAVGRGILSAVGEFAQIAGWVASDAGEYRRAEGAHRLGADAAREARDPALESHLVGSLAYQITNVGDPTDGVKAALASVSAAESSAMPRARALAWDRLAWAHARTGDAEAAQRALGEASNALAASGPANDDPDYLYWVNADELRIMEARVYTELHRPLRAIPLLMEVLETYEATHAREVALYMSWLAIALADANEIAEAATVAARMLELSSEIASERTALRARVVTARLAPHRDVPAVAAVLEAQRGRTRAGNPDSGWLE